MNKLFKVITFQLCFLLTFNFLAGFTAGILSGYFKSVSLDIDITQHDFDSNSEFSSQENESEFEKSAKKIEYLPSKSLSLLGNLNKYYFSLLYDISSHHNHTLEVPTSPPDYC